MDYKLTKFAYIPLFLDMEARTMILPNSKFSIESFYTPFLQYPPQFSSQRAWKS